MKTCKRLQILALLKPLIILLFSRPLFCDSIPGVPIIQQLKSNWCWAGASESILKYYIKGFLKKQSQIASVITTNDVKIPEEDIARCITLNGKPYGLSAQLSNKILTWQEAKQLADQKRPFIAILNLHQYGYHCNVYSGFIKDSTKIKLMDPMSWNGTSMYYINWDKFTTPDSLEPYWWKTIQIDATPISLINQKFNEGEFRIIHNVPSNRANVTLLFGDNSSRSRTITIFNTAGVTMFHADMRNNVCQPEVKIPVIFPSGVYFVTCKQEQAPGKNSIGKNHFIVKH